MKTLVFAAAVASLAGPALSATIFSEDFDGIVDPAISGAGTVTGVQGYDGLLDFSGNFLHNDAGGNPQATTNITLSGIGAHSAVTLSFSLALIDSWDGSALQDDAFVVRESGNELVRIIIDPFLGIAPATFPASVTDPISPASLAFSSGTPGDNERDTGGRVTLTFAHTASTLNLTFGAEGSLWSGSFDESWAIDSVSISTAPIPLPAGLPLLAGALGLLALARRRA